MASKSVCNRVGTLWMALVIATVLPIFHGSVVCSQSVASGFHAYLGRSYYSSTPCVRGYRDEIFLGIRPVGMGFSNTDFRRPTVSDVIYKEKSYYSVYMIGIEKGMYLLLGAGHKTIRTNIDRPFLNLGQVWRIPQPDSYSGYVGILGALISIPLEGTITKESRAWAMIRVSQGFLGSGSYDTDIRILTALSLWNSFSICFNLDLQRMLFNVDDDMRDCYRGAWGFGIAFTI